MFKLSGACRMVMSAPPCGKIRGFVREARRGRWLWTVYWQVAELSLAARLLERPPLEEATQLELVRPRSRLRHVTWL